MMINLFKGKKGQAGIAENIGNLLQTMPKELKIALFLIFLLFFALVFSYILNGFGVHCSSKNEVYVLPMYDFIHNINLIFKRPEYDAINLYSVEPEQLTATFAYECVHEINGSYYFEGVYCTECENISFVTYSEFGNTGLPTQSATKVCVGDVFANTEKGWFKKWICESRNFGCDVPEFYFFNASTGYLQPINTESYEYLSVGEIWDNKLVDFGGKLLYQYDVDESIDYRSGLRLSCTALNPIVTFYGIPIFDYRIWVLLIVIGGFFGFIIKLHNMDK